MLIGTENDFFNDNGILIYRSEIIQYIHCDKITLMMEIYGHSEWKRRKITDKNDSNYIKMATFISL